MPKNSPAKPEAVNAIDLLIEDHELVQQLFSEFEQLKSDEEDEDTKRELVEQACAELTIHAQIEEELFYPALRDALDDQDLLDEAEVEHDMAKQLIAELESMDPDEDLYDAKFTVLGEYVKHHIEEEQNEIFPRVKKAKLDLEALGEDLLQRKEELRAEFGLDEGEQVDEEEEDPDFIRSEQDNQPTRHPRA